MYRDNWNTIDRLQEEHRKELMQEAETYQLLQDEREYRPKRRNLLVAVVLWLARRLIGLGSTLRERSESMPVDPSPSTRFRESSR
jgi:hypothetical protein